MDITLSGNVNLQHLINIAADANIRVEDARANERTAWETKVNNYRAWVTRFLRLKNGTLAQVMQRIIEDYKIIILTGMNLGNRSAIALVDVAASNGEKYNVILVDQKYDQLPDEERFLYWQRYILHEIGHIVAKHAGGTLDGWAALCPALFQPMSKESVPESACSDEEEAEFLRVALKLGDGEDFVRRVAAARYQLDKIAYDNNIEIDCCAKYFIIHQPNQDWHYINKGVFPVGNFGR